MPAQKKSLDHPVNWIAILGKYGFKGREVVFHGELLEVPDQAPVPTVGNAISNLRLSGGTIEAMVNFSKLDAFTACEFILYFDPTTNFMVNAGIGGGGAAFSIRYFDGRPVDLSSTPGRSVES